MSSTSEVAMNIPYNIYITEEETNTLDREKIYVYITEVVEEEEIEVLHPQKLIYFSDYYKYNNSYILTNDNFRFDGTTEETKSRTYRLRMWVDAESNVTLNEDGSQSINIEGGTYEYKVHVDTNVTPEYCFAYTIDEEANEATITDYYCKSGNSYGYETITDLIIPTKLNEANVVTIGASTFRLDNITSVVIPNKVKTIEYRAFDTLNLTSITVGGEVTTIGDYSFQINKLTEITISDRVTTISNAAFNNNKMPDEEAYIYGRTDEDGDGIAEIDYTKIISYAGANKTPVVPEGVETIGQQTFYYQVITSVRLPSTLKLIGHKAFGNTKLTGVVIPTSVEYIYQAFTYSSLEYIVIPENSKLTNIEPGAFSSSNRADGSFVDNPNLIIYNNSGKAFDFQLAVNGTTGTPFITGTAPSYTDSSGNIFNEVQVVTGYPE